MEARLVIEPKWYGSSTLYH